MATKFKTNEQLLRALFNDLHTIEAALLRERLQKISALTRHEIEHGNRRSFNTPFTTANDWLLLCDKVDKHLGTEDKEPECDTKKTAKTATKTPKTQTVSITKQVTDQWHEDLIVTAIEGGSNYWYLFPEESMDLIENATFGSHEPFSIRLWKAIQTGISIPVYDIEDESRIGEISIESITKGEKLMAEQQSQHWQDAVNEMGDAITADVWFQFCSLGEIVYG
jgi:hypothetical protein